MGADRVFYVQFPTRRTADKLPSPTNNSYCGCFVIVNNLLKPRLAGQMGRAR